MFSAPIRISFFKYAAAFCACTALRLVPFRPPNLEPVLATVMPFSKAFGMLDAAVFAALNMVFFDLLTGHIGQWTAVTAVTYAVIAAGGEAFFRHYKGKGAYLVYAVIGTLTFDAVTGVIAGPVLFGQPFMEALTGQIPFTVNHLLGNLLLALVLSPLVERWIVRNRSLEGGVAVAVSR